jgi:hypothetical protein
MHRPFLGLFPGMTEATLGQLANHDLRTVRPRCNSGIVIDSLGVLAAASHQSVLQHLVDYGQIAAGVGALSVVASLLYVSKQVKLQAADSYTQMVTSLTSLMVSVSAAFIEHPEMRTYFHSTAIPEGKDRELALAIAVTMADGMDHVSAFLDRLDKDAQDAWLAYFKDIYKTSHIFKVYLDGHARWYGPKLRACLGISLPPV